MEFGQKIFREIDLFDFTSFFGLDFFKFSGPLCISSPPRLLLACKKFPIMFKCLSDDVQFLKRDGFHEKYYPNQSLLQLEICSDPFCFGGFSFQYRRPQKDHRIRDVVVGFRICPKSNFGKSNRKSKFDSSIFKNAHVYIYLHIIYSAYCAHSAYIKLKGV